MRIIREEQLLSDINAELGIEITKDNTDVLDRVDILQEWMEVYTK